MGTREEASTSRHICPLWKDNEETDCSVPRKEPTINFVRNPEFSYPKGFVIRFLCRLGRTDAWLGPWGACWRSTRMAGGKTRTGFRFHLSPVASIAGLATMRGLNTDMLLPVLLDLSKFLMTLSWCFEMPLIGTMSMTFGVSGVRELRRAYCRAGAQLPLAFRLSLAEVSCAFVGIGLGTRPLVVLASSRLYKAWSG